MPRVKRGKTHLKRRRRLLRAAKGYKWGRKKLPKLAKTAVVKAGVYAYRDRKNKKRERRRLWQTIINAKVREYGISYSRFMHLLKKNNIQLDRKILSEIAEHYPNVFTEIVKKVQ